MSGMSVNSASRDELSAAGCVIGRSAPLPPLHLPTVAGPGTPRARAGVPGRRRGPGIPAITASTSPSATRSDQTRGRGAHPERPARPGQDGVPVSMRHHPRPGTPRGPRPRGPTQPLPGELVEHVVEVTAVSGRRRRRIAHPLVMPATRTCSSPPRSRDHPWLVFLSSPLSRRTLRRTVPRRGLLVGLVCDAPASATGEPSTTTIRPLRCCPTAGVDRGGHTSRLVIA